MGTIGFIGSGNMAEALIKGVLTAKVCKAEQIFISDIRGERLAELADRFEVQPVESNAELAGKVDTLILSVKPQNMAGVLEEIKGSVAGDTLIISIAAGIKTAKIAKVLGDRPIIRVMPNTPALVGQGAAGLFATDTAAKKLQTAVKLFSDVGIAVVVDNEDLIDVVTAVSGSGPAYYFLLAEEMIKAATDLGLTADIAKKLVLQTAKGADALALAASEKGETVSSLREKVTSPGGTTEAALGVLNEGQFGSLLQKAVKAACDRSRQLSQ